MTMSEQQQQEAKKKTRKSYAQLLKEFEETSKKVASVYIRELCDGIKG